MHIDQTYGMILIKFSMLLSLVHVLSYFFENKLFGSEYTWKINNVLCFYVSNDFNEFLVKCTLNNVM